MQMEKMFSVEITGGPKEDKGIFTWDIAKNIDLCRSSGSAAARPESRGDCPRPADRSLSGQGPPGRPTEVGERDHRNHSCRTPTERWLSRAGS